MSRRSDYAGTLFLGMFGMVVGKSYFCIRQRIDNAIGGCIVSNVS